MQLMRFGHRGGLPLTLFLGLCLNSTLWAAGPAVESWQASREKGVEFLSLTQAADGSWTSPHAPGVTALAAFSILQSGVSSEDPVIIAAFSHLKSHIKADGGIYDVNSHHRNYETSIALMAFEAANSEGRYNDLIRNAVKFLKKVQWDEEETAGKADPAFGGSGYGTHQRPDLSNTAFFLEALKTAGVPADDPAVQNALTFISRCQNLEGEHNSTPFASKVNDGGFYYSPAAGGSSQAGTTPNGGLRSYASMTYAGLKSMIYAGVSEDDQRVKAARNWIQQFYTIEENPGMGQQGLYYYYHTFAKTLSTLRVDIFVETNGTKHDWRKELAEHLFAVQKENGSWVNATDRWYEGDPNLVTAYALLALHYCGPQKSVQ